MNVILFFTYGVSLKDWADAGLLNRELKIYEKMSKEQGINFTFLTYGDNKDFDYLDKESKLNLIPIYKFIKRPKSNFFRIIKSFYIPFYLKKLNENSNQIIKTNQLYGAWVAIIYKFLTGFPLITRTGYDLFSFSKYENKNIFKKLSYYLLTFFSLNFSNYYFVTSKTDFSFLIKKFWFNSKKLKLVPNWVEIGHTNESHERRANKVLVVGRLEKQKNMDLIVKSFNDTEFQVDIYGEGSLESYLKNTAKSSNINFKGVVEHQELLKLYQQYNFYVSMSSYEGNPKSTLEAMGSGCVVAVTDIENNRELVSNYKNGIIFNPLVDDIILILKKLNENTSLIKNIRASGIEYIKANNSITEVIKKEIEIYNLIYSSYKS